MERRRSIFDNGDKLIIENGGCVAYVLNFRFETSRFKGDTTDLYYWFPVAGRLLTGILGGYHGAIDIKRGLVYLDSYVGRDAPHQYKDLKLHDDIDFGGKELRTYLYINRIEKLSEIRYAVGITFVNEL